MRIILFFIVVLCSSGGAFVRASSVDLYENARAGFEAIKVGNWAVYNAFLKEERDSDMAMALELACHARHACPASFEDVVHLIRVFPTSPSLEAQLRRAENLALEASLSSRALLTWFSRFEPRSAEGQLAYIDSLAHLSKQNGGASFESRLYSAVKKIWREKNLNARQEQYFLSRYEKYLNGGDHEKRLEAMLWSSHRAAAERQSKRVGGVPAKLARARLALQTRSAGVDWKIRQVPALHHNEGLVFDRVIWRWRGNKKEQAIELALSDRSRKVAPDKWLNITLKMVSYLLFRSRVHDAERLLLAFKEDDIKKMSKGSKYLLWRNLGQVVLVWQGNLSGLDYYDLNKRAVTYMKRALKNVPNLEAKTEVQYWLARAYEALGSTAESRKWYRQAQRSGIYFYGQVAARKLGDSNKIAFVDKNHLSSEGRRRIFMSRPLVRLTLKLYRAGLIRLSRVYLHHMIGNLVDPFELSMAVQLSYDIKQIDAGVYASRVIERAGVALDERGYPWIRLKDEPPRPSLIMALVRQESSFNTQAKSAAGAKGLMQIMPGTAKYISQQIGKPYDGKGLIDDPHYNISMGSWYLDMMLEKFDNDLVLALAGYNAGPGAVGRWLERIGKPVADDIDSITRFIERIPYRETKRYVKKVLANYTIYRLLKERKQNTEIVFNVQ